MLWFEGQESHSKHFATKLCIGFSRAWKTGHISIYADDWQTSFAKHTRLQAYWLFAQANKLHSPIDKKVKVDKNAHFEQVFESVDQDFGANRLKPAFKGIRQTKKYVPTRPQAMPLEDGRMATEPTQIRGVWRDKWTKNLAGEVIDPVVLVERERAWYSQHIALDAANTNDAEGLPVVSSLESRHSRVSDCAHGENRIPTSVNRGCLHEINMLYYPLHLKASLVRIEPLHYKGPLRHELRKPKIPISQGTAAFRGVGIEDTDAKVKHDVASM